MFYHVHVICKWTNQEETERELHEGLESIDTHEQYWSFIFGPKH